MNSTETRTLAKLAGEAYDHFERAKRPGDDVETFTRLKDGAPEWLTDLVREAHRSGWGAGGDLMFPDDWRYDAIAAALAAIHDSDAETEDDLSELSFEFADGHVDAYNGERFAWLASHIKRASYCDEAAEEGLAEGADLTQRIGLGQYMEAREVFDSVARSLVEHLED